MTQSTDPNLFTRVLARQVAASDALHGVLTHLWWSAPAQGERVVQVYANERLHAVTLDPSHRELWLVFPPGRPVRLTLCAVDRSEAWVPRGADPDAQAPRDGVAVEVLRDPSVPVGARLCVTVDDGEAECAPLFGAGVGRSGFGGVFGFGGFGMDAAACPGLGLGELGLGPLGADGEAWRWCRDDLSAGPHQLGLALSDSTGGFVAQAQDVAFEIDRLPAPPAGLRVDDTLMLSWS
ncbi:MAG: hypothetical protein ACIAXF_09850 [Phycisphaerales bacterium JB063]